MKKTIICDIDGILCENERVHYALKRPYSKNIERLGELSYGGYRIVLFTSRKSRYRKETLRWLRKNHIQFDKLVMNKPKGDYYVDDKSIKLKKIRVNKD